MSQFLGNLSRQDIVGHSIKRVLVSPAENIDGFEARDVFVELSAGTAFSLTVDNNMAELPIASVDTSAMEALVESPDVGACYGTRIREVLGSRTYLGIGLLLESGRVLTDFIGEHGNSPQLLCGPDDEWHDLSEFVSYWGHKPVER